MRICWTSVPLCLVSLAACPSDTVNVTEGDAATTESSNGEGDGDGDPGDGDGDGDGDGGDGDGDGDGGDEPECGNGIVEDDEECDDGNVTQSDDCTNDCHAPECGDGIVQPNEGCDAGADNGPGNACNTMCQPNVCGDSEIGPGESCDDGNLDDSDECTNACALMTCGDAILHLGEECDDGNQVDEDECLNTCVSAVCGDGVLFAEAEVCDEGSFNSDTAECTVACEMAECGDGLIWTDVEECDLGPNNGPMSGCLESCEDNVCGDGFDGPQEGCDDGNDIDGDGCSAVCELEACGDGIVQPGEDCDDGNDLDIDDCTTLCAFPTCGDGFVQDAEACDDGNANSNSAACLSNCITAVCGDGYVHGGEEQCDNGMLNANDASCKIDCTDNNCGDGFPGPGEGCDDGNASNADACTNACALASCGDGFAQPGEECDDGDGVDNDACTNACTLPVCGDSLVQPGEQCDNGLNNGANAACNPDCENASCGDGYAYGAGGEACDDGDIDSTDGCTSACELPACGDGWVQNGEQCDDDSDDCLQNCTSVAWRVVHARNNFGMRDIWASSVNDVWAASTEDGIIRFDGSEWSAQSDCPIIGPNAVSGLSPTDVWAVGDNGAAHFDGNGWTLHELGDMFELFMVSTNDVWTFGAANKVYHWDGNAWSAIPSPLNVNSSYYVAFGASSSDVWFGAVENGDDRFVRWFNDELIEWVYYEPGTTIGANSMWGTATNDIWAVGGTAYHWNGVGWQVQNPGPIAPSDIHGYSADDYWLISHTQCAHWDGGGWTVRDLPNDPIGAFWGFPGGDDAWSSKFWWQTSAGVQRLQNNAWVSWSDSPLKGNGTSMWGTSATDVWVAGGTSMVHYDGAEWTASDFDGYPEVVWAHSETDAWAGGQNELHHWDGASWEIHTVLDPVVDVDGIWGSGPNDIWATTEETGWPGRGHLMHYDGTNWTSYDYIDDLVGNTYNGLWGLSADHVWLGQDGGGYWIFDGFGWIESDDNTTTDGFWGPEPYVIRTTPSSINIYDELAQEFDVETDPLNGDLHALWGTSATSIWAMGTHHFILKYDGNSWTPYNGPIVEEQRWKQEPVYSMWGTPEGEYFAAGQGGLILQRP